MHGQVPSGTRSLIFDMPLYLHPFLQSVNAIETVCGCAAASKHGRLIEYTISTKHSRAGLFLFQRSYVFFNKKRHHSVHTACTIIFTEK